MVACGLKLLDLSIIIKELSKPTTCLILQILFVTGSNAFTSDSSLSTDTTTNNPSVTRTAISSSTTSMSSTESSFTSSSPTTSYMSSSSTGSMSSTTSSMSSSTTGSLSTSRTVTMSSSTTGSLSTSRTVTMSSSTTGSLSTSITATTSAPNASSTLSSDIQSSSIETSTSSDTQPVSSTDTTKLTETITPNNDNSSISTATIFSTVTNSAMTKLSTTDVETENISNTTPPFATDSTSSLTSTTGASSDTYVTTSVSSQSSSAMEDNLSTSATTTDDSMTTNEADTEVTSLTSDMILIHSTSSSQVNISTIGTDSSDEITTLDFSTARSENDSTTFMPHSTMTGRTELSNEPTTGTTSTTNDTNSSVTTESINRADASQTEDFSLLYLAYILPSAFIIVLSIVISVTCLCRHRRQQKSVKHSATDNEGGYVLKRQKSYTNPGFMEQNIHAVAFQFNSRDSVAPPEFRTKQVDQYRFDDINLTEEADEDATGETDDVVVPFGTHYHNQNYAFNHSPHFSNQNKFIPQEHNFRMDVPEVTPPLPMKSHKNSNVTEMESNSQYDTLPLREESLPIKQKSYHGQNLIFSSTNIKQNNPEYDVLPMRSFVDNMSVDSSTEFLKNNSTSNDHLSSQSSEELHNNHVPEPNAQCNGDEFDDVSSTNENCVFDLDAIICESEAVDHHTAIRSPSYIPLERAATGSMRTAL